MNRGDEDMGTFLEECCWFELVGLALLVFCGGMNVIVCALVDCP